MVERSLDTISKTEVNGLHWKLFEKQLILFSKGHNARAMTASKNVQL